eukprot:TRINITY_DN4145_c0_g1_i2.p1 TRINITY_DN4145_c0_g1~~TRINITY_DN4145_c0_g1_i2.p1  ORF type:complete len:385 (-),score=75.59 TRINITY_DN4145_c0_g1_i2:128-1234(-)
MAASTSSSQGGSSSSRKDTKKRKESVPNEYPSLPGTSKFFSYTGVFITSGVWIVDREEGLDLYSCGFYGKGLLSRGGPNFYESGSSRPNAGNSSGFHIKHTKRVKVSREIVSNNNSNNNNSSSSSSSTPHKTHTHKSNPEKQPSNTNANTNTKLHEEYLQLSLVESFFLMYGLGCLRIIKPIPDHSNESEEDVLQSPLFHQNSFQELSIKQCWTIFCETQHNFPYLYTVYHHYRTHGWTPKSGLKYGTDFVLYQQGPSVFHAQHTIVVITIPEKELSCVNHQEEQGESSSSDQWEKIVPKDNVSLVQRTLSWGVLNNLNRVSEQVAKGLIVCYVVLPERIKSDTPLCLRDFKILPVKVSRWMPSKTRD